jgi:hypothetical protein
MESDEVGKTIGVSDKNISLRFTDSQLRREQSSRSMQGREPGLGLAAIWVEVARLTQTDLQLPSRGSRSGDEL